MKLFNLCNYRKRQVGLNTIWNNQEIYGPSSQQVQKHHLHSLSQPYSINTISHNNNPKNFQALSEEWKLTLLIWNRKLLTCSNLATLVFKVEYLLKNHRKEYLQREIHLGLTIRALRINLGIQLLTFQRHNNLVFKLISILQAMPQIASKIQIHSRPHKTLWIQLI